MMSEKGAQNPYAGLDTALIQMKRPTHQGEEHQGVETAKQPDTKTSKQHNAKTPSLVRSTIYLTAEQRMQLKRLELQRLEEGERADLSSLTREAIDLLITAALKRKGALAS